MLYTIAYNNDKNLKKVVLSMKIFDISWPLKVGMTEYKNRTTFTVRSEKNVPEHGVGESTLTMHMHTGTHIDAPAHFIANGQGVESVALSSLVGKCRVLDCTEVTEKITAYDLEHHALKAGEIVLLKTNNSFCEATTSFDPNFVYLDQSAAQLLAEKKIKTLGFDYLGIERNQPFHPTHKLLLQHDIAIIEGLRLAHIASGAYFLCCLPLALEGADAAPARAILFQDF